MNQSQGPPEQEGPAPTEPGVSLSFGAFVGPVCGGAAALACVFELAISHNALSFLEAEADALAGAVGGRNFRGRLGTATTATLSARLVRRLLDEGRA